MSGRDRFVIDVIALGYSAFRGSLSTPLVACTSAVEQWIRILSKGASWVLPVCIRIYITKVQFSHLVIVGNLSLNISSLDNYGKTGRTTSKSGSVKPSNFSTYGPAFYFKAFFY